MKRNEEAWELCSRYCAYRKLVFRHKFAKKIAIILIFITYRRSNVTGPKIVMPCQKDRSKEPKEKPAQRIRQTKYILSNESERKRIIKLSGT